MVSLLRQETSEKGKLNLLKITYLDYRMVFFLLKYRLRNINVCSQLLFLCKQLSLRGNSTIRFNHTKTNKQSKPGILMKLMKSLMNGSTLWTSY